MSTALLYSACLVRISNNVIQTAVLKKGRRKHSQDQKTKGGVARKPCPRKRVVSNLYWTPGKWQIFAKRLYSLPNSKRTKGKRF